MINTSKWKNKTICEYIFHVQLRAIKINLKLVSWYHYFPQLQVQYISSKTFCNFCQLFSLWKNMKLEAFHSCWSVHVSTSHDKHELKSQPEANFSWKHSHQLTDQVSQILSKYMYFDKFAGIILCLCPANERKCYNVTLSLIGWAHIQNDPWMCCSEMWNEYPMWS